MHGELTAELAQRGGVGRRLERHQHADLAQARNELVVHVADHDALGHFEARDAAQVHVLADGGDEMGQVSLDGLVERRHMGLLDRVDIVAVLDRELGDAGHQFLELVVAGDEIGLGVNLDDDADLAVGRDADQALGGDAPGLLGGGREALLAQPVDGLLDVAADFAQRALAIHHARARLLAQLFDQSGGDLCHRCSPRKSSCNGCGPSRRPAPEPPRISAH